MKIPTFEELGITFHGSLAQLVHHVHIDHAPDRPNVRCFVTLKVRDATNDKGETITVTAAEALHYAMAENHNLAAWRAWVIGVVRLAWKHEFDEGVKIDGRHVDDPHPEHQWAMMKPEPMKLRRAEDYEL